MKEAKSEASNEEELQSMIFTHINSFIKEKLANYLTVSISKKIQVYTEIYENTIEVIFSSPEDILKYSQICGQPNHLKALQTFGFKNEIRMGLNTGHLHILNYDKAKELALRKFLKSQMKEDVKEIEVLKRGNRYVIDCKMSAKALACAWLDRILIKKLLKDFKIPGAQNGFAPVLKVFIHCEEIKN
jgi:hypothetical protein